MLTPLILIRHGPTGWNAEGRMQGRSDQPLSESGRAQVGRWTLPDEVAAYRWMTSPLRRARETAMLLGHGDAEVVAALIETDWGEWEGRKLKELREYFGDEMEKMEARGLDFRPPGGESPRDLQDRLKPWLASFAAAGRPGVAVCHKGVIRALAALASGWDMTGRPPEKLRAETAHCFRIDAAGQPAIERLNHPLVP